MIDQPTIKKIKGKIDKDEQNLRKSIIEIERIWEDTGLEPNDPTYLVEKTMRFETAQQSVTKVFVAFSEIISQYKKLCSELEKTNEEE